MEVERLLTPTLEASDAENAGDAVLFAAEGADCRRSLFFGRKILCANSSALRLWRSVLGVRMAAHAIINEVMLAFLNDLVKGLCGFIRSHDTEIAGEIVAL